MRWNTSKIGSTSEFSHTSQFFFVSRGKELFRPGYGGQSFYRRAVEVYSHHRPVWLSVRIRKRTFVQMSPSEAVRIVRGCLPTQFLASKARLKMT